MTADKELIALLKLRQAYWLEQLGGFTSQEVRALASAVISELSSILHAATGNSGIPVQSHFDEAFLDAARKNTTENVIRNTVKHDT